MYNVTCTVRLNNRLARLHKGRGRSAENWVLSGFGDSTLTIRRTLSLLLQKGVGASTGDFTELGRFIGHSDALGDRNHLNVTWWYIVSV